LIYLPKEKVSNYNFKGKEILVTEDMDTHADLPSVVGIITENPHQPLSHIALRVRERNIPWYSPLHSEFLLLKQLAIKNSGKPFEIKAYIGDCSIDHVKKISKGIIKKQKESIKLLFNIDRNRKILREEDYTLEEVGAKGYYLKTLSQLFPGRIPPSISLSFSFFKELFESDKNLYREIEELTMMENSKDKSAIDLKLSKIRESIMKIKLPKIMEEELQMQKI
jgi:hypothetical protein